jgi:hypothetical protein
MAEDPTPTLFYYLRHHGNQSTGLR